MEDIVIGNYELIPDDISAEGEIRINLKPIDLITYWKRCGIMANFAALFYANTRVDSSLFENSISTVFNELIENATKYSKKQNSIVAIHMKMYDSVLKITIENSTTEKNLLKFKDRFSELMECEDLDQLYFDTLLAEADNNEEKHSGIGLLLLLKDYPLKLGAHLRMDPDNNNFIITIQAFYYLD